MTSGITRADLRAAALWLAAALALYLATGARGLVWADSSKLTLYALSGYFPSLNPGDHAGWTVLAWGWLRLVGGDPVVAAHRLSAVFGALAVALAPLVIVVRSGDRGRAHTAAALLLAALPLWWAATVAETYTAALALTLAGGLALGRAPRGWRWTAAGVVWGLALACHAMALFVIAPLAWEAGGRRCWRLLPGVAVGAGPAWLAVFGGPRDPMTGFAASGASTWQWVWAAFVAAARMPRGLMLLGAVLIYSFGILGVVALWQGRGGRRGGIAWAASLGALAVLLSAYALYRIHLMAVFLVAGIVLAAPVRLGRTMRFAAVALQAACYVAVPALLTVAAHRDVGVRVLPFRNNAFYFLCPIKGLPAVAESWAPATLFRPGTERYVRAIGECAPRAAVVLSDFNPGAPLRLAQVARGWRPDLEVRPAAVDVALGSKNPVAALVNDVERDLARRPVVLADSWEPYYRAEALAAYFDLHRCVAGVRVEPRQPASRARGTPEGRGRAGSPPVG